MLDQGVDRVQADESAVVADEGANRRPLVRDDHAAPDRGKREGMHRDAPRAVFTDGALPTRSRPVELGTDVLVGGERVNFGPLLAEPFLVELRLGFLRLRCHARILP